MSSVPPTGRTPRGVVFPSPVVMLSIIAIAMAGIAYFATQGQVATEREVTTVASTDGSFPSLAPSPEPTPKATKKPAAKPEQPAVNRNSVYVEVYNNSAITGLAARYASRASALGWQVVGADNWYGNVPASTVYYPARLAKAAEQLARDLGIARLRPAVDPMRLDRLTVVLTSDAA